MEIFWKTIGEYNTQTWRIQLAITIAGAVLTCALYARPTRKIYAVTKGFMAAVCLWIAAAYYLTFCAEREYSGAMAVFWIFMAMTWIYDIGNKKVTPQAVSKNPVAPVLLSAPLIYPLLSLACGRSFPEMTSPIMPCSVVVFSIGVVFVFEKRINLILAMLLLHWAILSIPKTKLYGITEDYFLALCTIPAIYLFLKNYITQVLVEPTKPSKRVLEYSLFLLCATIGTFFSVMILRQFSVL